MLDPNQLFNQSWLRLAGSEGADVHRATRTPQRATHKLFVCHLSLDGGILHLRYENDIQMINRNSRVVVRWSTCFRTTKKMCYIEEICNAELNNKYIIYRQLTKDKRK
jgi:hypothetical protein